MSGFLGIGGVNSKQQNQSIGNLNNLFNIGLKTSQNLTSSGSGDTGSASSYFSNLLSGNRSALSQAIAPEAKSVSSAADAQRRQQATMGTARGGGVASGNQQAQTQTQATIDDALFKARPAAASSEAQIGAGETSAGLGFAGAAGNAAGAAGNIATNARSQAGQEFQAAIKDIFGFGGTGL